MRDQRINGRRDKRHREGTEIPFSLTAGIGKECYPNSHTSSKEVVLGTTSQQSVKGDEGEAHHRNRGNMWDWELKRERRN